MLNNVKNKTPITDELEYRWIKAKDGTPKLFQWSNSKGNDDSIIFVGINITDKHEKERQFKTLTENRS